MTEALKIDKPDCSDTFEIQTELQTAHTEELEHDRFTHKITLTVDEDTKKPQNLDKTYILVKIHFFAPQTVLSWQIPVTVSFTPSQETCIIKTLTFSPRLVKIHYKVGQGPLETVLPRATQSPDCHKLINLVIISAESQFLEPY